MARSLIGQLSQNCSMRTETCNPLEERLLRRRGRRRRRVFLCVPDSPRPPSVDQADLKLRDLPASASQVLGIKGNRQIKCEGATNAKLTLLSKCAQSSSFGTAAETLGSLLCTVSPFIAGTDTFLCLTET